MTRDASHALPRPRGADEPGDAAPVFDLDAMRTALRAAPEAGRLAGIGLGRALIGERVLEHTGDEVARLCPRATQVLLLADDTVMRRAGESIKDLVGRLVGAHRPVRHITLGDGGEVHADEPTVAAASGAATGAGAVVSVGSGTVTDIAKVAAARSGAPHVVVQTAASVNGFSDNQSVLLRDGAKRTMPSRWPDTLVADLDVLADAPRELTAAGVGDGLSMFTALGDWYLAGAVGIETSYAPTVAHYLTASGARLFDLAPGLAHADRAALAGLVELLTLSGVAMGAVGRTAPSSGMEHTISHLLDMHAAARGEPVALHGAQVGAGCVVAAAVWRRVRERLATGPRRAVELPDHDTARRRVHAAFDRLGAATARECWEAYRRKLDWLATHRGAVQALLDRWDAHAAAIDRLVADPATLAAALRAAGAPVTFDRLRPAPTAGTLRWAVANCHLMRDRFTVADLAALLGAWTHADVDAVLDELERLAEPVGGGSVPEGS